MQAVFVCNSSFRHEKAKTDAKRFRRQ